MLRSEFKIAQSFLIKRNFYLFVNYLINVFMLFNYLMEVTIERLGVIGDFEGLIASSDF